MTELPLPETRYALSGDVSIAYQVMDGGPLDLVLVPGLISHVEAFHEPPGYTAFLRRLSAFARVITFDKRGQGLSDRMVDVPSLETRMDDVRAVLDAVGSRRAVLMGFSEGAAMSALFAATYPDRASHLILSGGFATFPPADAAVLAQRDDARVKAWGNGAALKRARSPDRPVSEEDMALFGRIERLSASPGSMRAFAALNNTIDVTAILGAIRIPSLVLHRTGDVIVDVERGRELAGLIPGARMIEYPEPYHEPWVGNTEAILGDIEEFVTGQRAHAAADLDRILATVLFTDIAGSTERAVQLGDQRWRELLDQHDRLARRMVEQHRGTLVKSTGDGVLATFDGPGRAVRCALAFAAAAGDIGVPLRAGLHTGEIERRGRDIGGVAVHTAARVMAQSQPGEVLVSRVVTDLVAGAGLQFAERGSHELKGLPGRWDLFAAAL
jgi:class 3 adenylate cyclase